MSYLSGKLAPGLTKKFRPPKRGAVNRDAEAQHKRNESNYSSLSAVPILADVAFNEENESDETDVNDGKLNHAVLSDVASALNVTVNSAKSSPNVARKPSPRKTNAGEEDSGRAPAKKKAKPAASSDIQLDALSKDCFFSRLVCTMEPEEFVEWARTACNNDAKKLTQMIVATARFHMDRCNNQMNLSEFFQRYHNALSGSFSKLSNATNLRNSYNNNASKATVPVHPPLPLPPGVMPVNVHAVGAAGQHCGRGAGRCVASRNGAALSFARVTISLGGGSGTINQQFCSTCDDCFAEAGFDPLATFADKRAFDAHMAAYATRHSFKLTKETGAKVDAGSTKLPKYLAVRCSKKSAHRRGSDCSCPFKVSAVLQEKGDGSYEYKLNVMQLTHE